MKVLKCDLPVNIHQRNIVGDNTMSKISEIIEPSINIIPIKDMLIATIDSPITCSKRCGIVEYPVLSNLCNFLFM